MSNEPENPGPSPKKIPNTVDDREELRLLEYQIQSEEKQKEDYWEKRNAADLRSLDDQRPNLQATLDAIRARHDREGKPAYLTKLTTPPEYTGEPRVAERQLQAVRDRFAADPWPSMESKVAEAWAKRKPGELWCDIGKRFKMSGNEAMVLYEAFQARLLTGGVK